MKVRYVRWILLLICLLCLSVVQFVNNGVINTVSTFLWLTLFCYVVTTAENKKELFAAAAVSAVGFAVRNWGTVGSLILDIVLLGAAGVLLFLICLAYRALVRGRNGFVYTLYFPLLWMSAFLLFSFIGVPSILRIDMWFFDFKPLIQSEAYISSYGLSFLILWSAALIAYTVRFRKASGIITAAALSLVLTAAGLIRLSDPAEPKDHLRTAYTTGPYVGDFSSYYHVEYPEMAESASRSVEKAAEQQAELLVFNEESFEVNAEEAEKLTAHFSELARAHDMYLLVGFDQAGLSEKRANRLVFFAPDGSCDTEYEKRFIVPVIEGDYRRGENVDPASFILNAHGQSIPVSYAICYDSNFSFFIDRMSRDTQLLILPSWDWKGVTASHARICGCLAVETGTTVLKATYDGISDCTDPYGTVLHRSDTGETGFEYVQTVDLPLYENRTTGAILAQQILFAFPAAFIVLLAADILKRRKNR